MFTQSYSNPQSKFGLERASVQSFVEIKHWNKVIVSGGYKTNNTNLVGICQRKSQESCDQTVVLVWYLFKTGWMHFKNNVEGDWGEICE